MARTLCVHDGDYSERLRDECPGCQEFKEIMNSKTKSKMKIYGVYERWCEIRYNRYFLKRKDAEKLVKELTEEYRIWCKERNRSDFREDQYGIIEIEVNE